MTNAVWEWSGDIFRYNFIKTGNPFDAWQSECAAYVAASRVATALLAAL